MHKIWPGKRSRAHWVKYKNINNSDLDGRISLASFCQSRGLGHSSQLCTHMASMFVYDLNRPLTPP